MNRREAKEANRQENQKSFVWETQQPGYERLLRIADGQTPTKVFGAPLLSEAFRLDSTGMFLGCMDDRVNMNDKKDDSKIKIGIGANGRLLDHVLFEALIFRIKQEFRERLHRTTNWMKVTYHAACGACGIYCKETNPRRTKLGIPEWSPVEAGKDIAMKIAQSLEIADPPIFIPSNWLAVSPQWHPARNIIVDTTGVGRPQKLQESDERSFPHSFQLSGSCYPSMEHLSKELEVAISIALDKNHGMGERFTADQPLLVTTFEDPTACNMVDDIRKVIDEVLKRHTENVRGVRFKVPKKHVRNDIAATLAS